MQSETASGQAGKEGVGAFLGNLKCKLLGSTKLSIFSKLGVATAPTAPPAKKVDDRGSSSSQSSNPYVSTYKPTNIQSYKHINL